MLDETLQLAGQLEKDKKTALAAIKYLNEVITAAEAAVREVGKAKAEEERKAQAAASKKARRPTLPPLLVCPATARTDRECMQADRAMQVRSHGLAEGPGMMFNLSRDGAQLTQKGSSP